MRNLRISVIGKPLGSALLLAAVSLWPVAAMNQPAHAQRGAKPRIVHLTREAAVNGFTIETVANTFQFRTINVRHPDTGRPLEGKHDVELFCELPFIKKLLFNKGNSERTRLKCLMLMVTPRIIINE